MVAVTVSSSASSAQLGLCRTFSSYQSPLKIPRSLAYKSNKAKNTTLVVPSELATNPNDDRERLKSSEKKRVILVDESPSCTLELDYRFYSEAAAKLESIYKHCLATEPDDVEDKNRILRKKRQQKRKKKMKSVDYKFKKQKRLCLDERIAMRESRVGEMVSSIQKKNKFVNEVEKINKLLREYSSSVDFVSFDWKKMNMPPVLPSSEQAWLFKLMQPMKALLEVKEKLLQEMRRDPTVSNLAIATNTTPVRVRKELEIGQAARRKLIKHNLRLVLFVVHKYFPEFGNGPKFQDLCQAGVKGLITAIDRFEPKRKLQLSTLGFFWIRHAVRQYVTLSSFTRVSYGLELVRSQIQRAKLELSFELQRVPTEEEIISKIGISAKRYHEVMRVSKPVLSLHFKHAKTQEEAINGIIEADDVASDNWRQPALLRRALDDALDFLRPKERLVIRERYGLDGKCDKTLGEVAGSMNISKEMVRKHELKALKKLQDPARVDCVRAYIA